MVSLEESTVAVRAFNRFYTGVIGVLDSAYLSSPYSLTEVRVLFELAAGVEDVKGALGLDAGYLSRILGRFERDGLVTRSPSPVDARRHVVALTERGRAVMGDLNARSDAEIGALLERVPSSDHAELVGAMRKIQRILGERPRSYLLRPLQPGDLGWVVQRHGVRYALEYGYDVTFEALVAQVVAEYAGGSEGSAGWIAEVDGEAVGSVFCVRRDAEVAQLRLLLVEPEARGLGIGKRLVEECVRFARRTGYRRVVLETVSEVEVARGIYRRVGFTPVDARPVRKWGRDVVEETWALEL
ncbi:bifunctional helix-turn-helix transcriptional regulator/GNAT family N-acetyltransferase [Saccharothrix obliqua]|uniref:bifunctional helix-turn-helix transcriptional regulator/GNAT family N-acetyltransferase n=1 Tax=Saccharothrix obliqua TaxID=2861747 RepID=UPI001C5D11DE|nr:helix-turn-helix domain-containing GNAT family N-acetyltransferase [Saccharothrix obliqua]MBW4717690.1 helix-turn-helix domain-containing GNAT family N-acetyltransferase [Saccharothrix obliqua]